MRDVQISQVISFRG